MLVSVPLTIVVTLGVHAALPDVDLFGTRPFLFLSPPSFVATFTIVLKLYDEYLWCATLWGKRLSKIPNLDGIWLGYVTIESPTPRPEEPQGRIPCHVEIRQTWSEISLDFETDFTTSSLVMASINKGKGLEGGFQYEYVVTPKAGSQLEKSGMGLHVGMAKLAWDEPNPSSLDGYFYNGPGYQRYGLYHLDRDPEQQTAAQWRRRVLPKADAPG